MATPDSTPHEYIDAEITLEELAGPADEKKLLDVLSKLDGLRNASVTGPQLRVEYEPVLVHKSQIVEAITEAGFRIKEVESAPASPMIDALRET